MQEDADQCIGLTVEVRTGYRVSCCPMVRVHCPILKLLWEWCLWWYTLGNGILIKEVGSKEVRTAYLVFFYIIVHLFHPHSYCYIRFAKK